MSQVPGLQSEIVDKDYGDEKSAANDYQVGDTYIKLFLHSFFKLISYFLF